MKEEKNTGWGYDLVDTEKAQRKQNGSMKDAKAQMGNYDTRHKAIGMKVIIENRFPEMDYQVRAHETMWRERDEPVICGYCGYETWYMPLVRWYFYGGENEGPFCSLECTARWAHNETDRTYPKQ